MLRVVLDFDILWNDCNFTFNKETALLHVCWQQWKKENKTVENISIFNACEDLKSLKFKAHILKYNIAKIQYKFHLTN